MSQEKRIPETKSRISLGSFCGVSGLLLSIVCCVTLVHVEFRIQEHHRLLSHPTAACYQMEEEIFAQSSTKFQSIIILLICVSTVAPRVSISSNQLMAEEEQTVTIACSATGQPPPNITWSKSIGNLPDTAAMNNSVLKINKVSKEDGGIYICKAGNFLGAAEDTIQLVIFSRLRFKVRPPAQVTAVIGYPMHLPCVAESDLKTTVMWLKDESLSLPAGYSILQNNTLVLSSVKKSHEGSYTCKVINAVASIEASIQVKTIAPSCSVIRKYVSSSSGNYVIDPDGAGGLAPFTVYCDMSDKNGVGVTVISHDSESRTLVDGYDGDGGYSRSIHYSGASLSQLASLTDVSLHCEQFIKYECYGSMLFYSSTGDIVGWWVSRNSSKMLYWGGASPESNKCACGMTNSCADPRRVCNCDKNDGVWREDSGLLNDKSTLPVKELRFGDTDVINNQDEKGYHTLDKFKCHGIAHE